MPESGPITNLSGLEGAANLKELGFPGNSISSLAPLMGLSRLSYLNLADNHISDIAPLAGLTNLEYLNLSHNPLTNCAHLAGLTRLSDLQMRGASLTDLSWSSNLVALGFLDLTYNGIQDVGPLTELTNLYSLRLGFNPLTNYTMLGALTNLGELYLENCHIGELDFLKSLVNLGCVSLQDNRLTNIAVLEHLPLLGSVSLAGNLLRDIDVLDRLPLWGMVDVRWNLLDLSAGAAALTILQDLESRCFNVIYLPQWQPPQVEVRRQWVVAANETTRLTFSLMDDTTVSTQVVVTAHSSNPGLIPDSNIVARPTIIDGWYVNWGLSVTPVVNQAGVATVTLTATDSTGMSTNIPILVEVCLPQPLDGQSLNCPNLQWQSYGEGPWFSQTNISHDGGGAVQSGSPGSWLESTVEGPGTLTFWWRAASMSSWAGGVFSATCAATGWSDRRVIGIPDVWQPAGIELPAGSWHLKWDSICEPWLDGGSNTFWLDEVSFVPGSPACWLEVLPGPPADFVLLVLHGESGSFYEVETSNDLKNWSVLRRLQLNFSTSVTEESNPEPGARFYRMRKVAAQP